MSIFLKLCALFFSFLNLFVHTQSQDIIGAILGGVQNGMNLLNNNVNIGQRDYPDYGSPTNRDVSVSRSKEVSQSNQNDSEESSRSNSEQRGGDSNSDHGGDSNSDRGSDSNSDRGGDSNSVSDEYDRENPKYFDNKKILPINNQIINNNEQNRSPNRQPSSFNGNIQSKPFTKPTLFNNQFITQNKDKIKIKKVKKVKKKKHNPDNVDTNITIFPGNSTQNDIFKPSTISDSLLNQNTLNSTYPLTDKTIKEEDNVKILKPLTKRQFFFQAKPVLPLSEEVETTEETIYYIDLD